MSNALQPTLPDLESAVHRICDTVLAGLQSIGSSIVADGRLSDDLIATVRDIVFVTYRRLNEPGSTPGAVSVLYAVTPEFAAIAQAEANMERHPAEPLMAAEVIFGAALPELVELLDERCDAVDVARTLHNEIWRRFPPGAIAYVEFILAKLARAQLEERRALSRELHDRVAHRMAAALQRTELARVAGVTEDASRHLNEAERELIASLEDVQDIAVALRLSAGDRPLAEAIEDYVARLPDHPSIELETTGTPSPLLFSVAEEVLTIVTEAVRNARRHADGVSVIKLRLMWTPTTLKVEVSDDGRGFDPGQIGADSNGMRSMNERSQVIGARLRVSTSPQGTVVKLVLPLGRATVAP